jgi:hypothetical protein
MRADGVPSSCILRTLTNHEKRVIPVSQPYCTLTKEKSPNLHLLPFWCHPLRQEDDFDELCCIVAFLLTAHVDSATPLQPQSQSVGHPGHPANCRESLRMAALLFKNSPFLDLQRSERREQNVRTLISRPRPDQGLQGSK